MTDAVIALENVLIRNLKARARLLTCILIGVCVFAIMPGDWRLSTRILSSWNLAAVLYVVAACIMIARSTPESIQRRAVASDEGRFVALSLACLAAAAAFAAIFDQLTLVKDSHGLYHTVHLALAGCTVLSAWTFTHLMFTQHYAHEYFIERDSEKDLPEEFRGGLDFPGTKFPVYSDFVYFAFIVGVASQTADVEITSSVMRRISLLHSVLSFVFNTAILALTINIASGLIAP